MLRPQIDRRPCGLHPRGGAQRETDDPTKGLLAIAMRHAEYEIGEVVVYTVPDGSPATGSHVISHHGGTAEDGFVMQGDNAEGSDLWRPKEGDIVGRAEIVVPGACQPSCSPDRRSWRHRPRRPSRHLVLGMWAPKRRPLVEPEPSPGVGWQPSHPTRFE